MNSVKEAFLEGFKKEAEEFPGAKEQLSELENPFVNNVQPSTGTMLEAYGPAMAAGFVSPLAGHALSIAAEPYMASQMLEYNHPGNKMDVMP